MSASRAARARLVVVKANAYGHGIELSGARWGHRWLSLVNLEEAITLRERGWRGRILMLKVPYSEIWRFMTSTT
ncbi:alanine racemase [Escherichia coli]